MEDIKEMLRVIVPYLPNDAKVLKLGTYYNKIAIDKQDLSGDGYEEVIAIYEHEEENYLIVIEGGKSSEVIVYNKPLPFVEISYFTVENIVDSSTKQIMIGGKKESEDEKYQLEILKYTEKGLESVLKDWICFHKIDTQKVENKVQIIVWEHIMLEAYMINMYRYENEEILLGGWDETIYFKSVVGYYSALVDMHPEEDIYKQCLENARERSSGKLRQQKESTGKISDKNGEIKMEEDNNQIRSEESREEEQVSTVEDAHLLHKTRCFECTKKCSCKKVARKFRI